jgi:hypothetical protein
MDAFDFVIIVVTSFLFWLYRRGELWSDLGGCGSVELPNRGTQSLARGIGYPYPMRGKWRLREEAVC